MAKKKFLSVLRNTISKHTYPTRMFGFECRRNEKKEQTNKQNVCSIPEWLVCIWYIQFRHCNRCGTWNTSSISLEFGCVSPPSAHFSLSESAHSSCSVQENIRFALQVCRSLSPLLSLCVCTSIKNNKRIRIKLNSLLQPQIRMDQSALYAIEHTRHTGCAKPNL